MTDTNPYKKVWLKPKQSKHFPNCDPEACDIDHTYYTGPMDIDGKSYYATVFMTDVNHPTAPRLVLSIKEFQKQGEYALREKQDWAPKTLSEAMETSPEPQTELPY